MPQTLPSKANPWIISKSIGDIFGRDGGSLLKYVEFNITGRCQTGCITCPTVASYSDEKIFKDNNDLAVEFRRFQDYFRRLKEFGLEFVTIYGREPILWDKEAQGNKFLKDLIVWLNKELKVRVCLATSGLDLSAGLLKVLFDNNGVLFMKDWGSRESVKQLIKNKDAYCKIHKSWALVRRLGKNYKKTRVLAEFLYTGINRRDLPSFWKRCLRSGIIPFVEVPIIKGRCADNFRKLKIDRRLYVKDIYELSLLNLSILCGMTKREAKRSDLWQPPYGSVFPSPCNKLTRAKGLFLERDGNLSVCCGISAHLGNISDKGIDKKLKNSFLLKGIRSAYNNLKGFCGACDYSRDMHICYGCRGNAYTYTGNNEGVFGEDPMCFGRLAIALDKKGELNKIMSLKHVDILRKYFGEKRDAGDH